jgi:hypothetical protein
VVEALADFGGDGGLGDYTTPVQEEVVVIENVVLLLSCDIGLKDPSLRLPASSLDALANTAFDTRRPAA